MAGLILLACAVMSFLLFRSLEGSLAKQLTALNTMLMVMILAKAAKAAFGEIDNWGEVPSDKRAVGAHIAGKEKWHRQADAKPKMPESDIAKAHAELIKQDKADKEGMAEHKPRPQNRPEEAAAEAPVSRPAPQAEQEMVGYAELVNINELMFNSPPRLRVISGKNTFAIYRSGEEYNLTVSEHWMGASLQYDTVVNGHLRNLFEMAPAVSGRRHIIRKCTPAQLTRLSDGAYELKSKGTAEVEIL